MNNNADIDFLRFLSREHVTMMLSDALSIMDVARRLYTPEPQNEGAIWQGLYFAPEADDALREDKLVTAIKRVRDDNPEGMRPNAEGYRFNAGVLALRDAKDVCEARRKFLRGW